MTDAAAFFRFEGTLSPRPTLATAAWLAANSQGLGERIARLGNVALAAPFLSKTPLRDPTVGNRMAWMGLRGVSDDRLHFLGEEYAEEQLIPNLREVGLELLEDAKRNGHRVVLISDNLESVLRPIAAHLGIEDVVCNRMEFRDQKATGRLNDPVISGRIAGDWVRDFADHHDLRLPNCLAYGAHADDSLLLGLIGKPCAVHPDRELRCLARDLDWPVVEG
ncbi:MAG: haloacid dehalogenase-like hydrolase [Myxococcota bacterium]